MAERHSPLCIALRNSAHIRSLIYVDPTRRLCLTSPFYRWMNHHPRRERDLCKVTQRVLTETGSGPKPGPSPSPPAPPLPRTIQPQSPTRLLGDGAVNKLLLYVRNKKTDASTSQILTEPPRVAGGGKGSGWEGGHGASSPPLLPSNQQSQGHLLTSSHSHHLSPSTAACLVPQGLSPVPYLACAPQSLLFTAARAVLSKHKLHPQIPPWLP